MNLTILGDDICQNIIRIPTHIYKRTNRDIIPLSPCPPFPRSFLLLKTLDWHVESNHHHHN